MPLPHFLVLLANAGGVLVSTLAFPPSYTDCKIQWFKSDISLPYLRTWYQPSSQINLFFFVKPDFYFFLRGRWGQVTASNRYQTPLLNLLRFAQEAYCILSCIKNISARAQTSPHRPALPSFTHPLPMLYVGKSWCSQKHLSRPTPCLQNMLASSHEGHLGRATTRFASFVSTREGCRKGFYYIILHRQVHPAKMTGKIDHPFKQFPLLKPEHKQRHLATWALHSQIL